MRNQSGQSLVEVVIALTIGSILISAATFAIVVMLRTVSVGERIQVAVIYNQDFLESVRSFAFSDWQNIYSLEREESYYLVASGTQTFAVKGKEGIFEHGTRSGIAGHWKLDEESGLVAYDSSGNNHHGSLVNNPTRATSTCILGGCLEFNGSNNGIEVENFSQIFENSVTLSLWAYFNDDTRGILFGNYNSFNDVNFEKHTSQRLRIYWNRGERDVYTPDNAFELNQWVYLVLIRNKEKNQFEFWVNGIFVNNVSNAGSDLLSTSDTFRIGRDSRTGATVTDGMMDDVRIYNRALSEDEIRNLYESLDFRRYFIIEDVCRTNAGEIGSESPCEAPYFLDPSTLRVNIVTEWDDTAGGVSKTEEFAYFTRQRNEVLIQTDWSKGPGATGTQEESESNFVDSTNIDYESNRGSIMIDLESTPE